MSYLKFIDNVFASVRMYALHSLLRLRMHYFF